MGETIIHERALKGRKPNGHLVRATAQLYHIQGNSRPHFSFTTSSGCDHDSILAAFPELSRLVALHLSDDEGAPIHAVANAVFHAEKGDKAALARHLRVDDSFAERIIGRVACIPSEFGDKIAGIVAAEKDELKAARDRTRQKFLQADRDGSFLVGRHKKAAEAAKAKYDAYNPVNEHRRMIAEKIREYMESVVATQRTIWRELARECIDWLKEADTYESGDPDSVDMSGLVLKLNGEAVNVEVVGYADNTVTDGDQEHVIYADRESAGRAARKYWADMAKDDPSEFACIVGEQTLVQWALGQPAGPGSAKVRSLEAWLDLYLANPAEELARYDGEEITAHINANLATALGIDWGLPDFVDGGFIEVVAYRTN